MRARVLPGLCLLAGACAAVVTADEIDLDEPGLPEPVDPAIRPDAVAAAPAPTPAPEPDVEVMAAAHACIDDLLVDARARGLAQGVWTSPDMAPTDLSIERLTDVDGDGDDEWLVTHETDCGVTGNCPFLLYRSHGCTHFAGAFWSAYTSVLPRTRGGVHDLETWVKGGCAGIEGSIRRLRWTGLEYQAYATIECGCDETDPARHPDCPGVE